MGPLASDARLDAHWMSLALRLARRGLGRTSPNPMVGAVLVKEGRVLGKGWHHQAGAPHAEIEAINDALAQGHHPAGGTLYITLEPCSTHGRTPPCTEAILKAGIQRVVVAATDPNPKHAGRAFGLLRQAGLEVVDGVRAAASIRLNEAFNHWIVHQTPFVTVKAAMTLDGKIATVSGASKWITSPKSRAVAMQLRQAADAVLVGVNTVLHDDPRLTVRRGQGEMAKRRIILDAHARTPPQAQVAADPHASFTTIVVSEAAPAKRLSALRDRANVLVAPAVAGKIDLRWLLAQLGHKDVTHLLVEGGGEVNASFLLGGFAHRIAFFYAPKIFGGRDAPGPVGGPGIASLEHALLLSDIAWRRLGDDLWLTARLGPTELS